MTMRLIIYVLVATFFLKNSLIAEANKLPIASRVKEFRCDNFDELKQNVIKQLEKSWCTQEKINLMMDLVLQEKPKVCVEIGAFTGSSVLPVAATLGYLRGGKIFAIDCWSNAVACADLDEGDPNKVWLSTVDMGLAKNQFISLLHKWKLQHYCSIIHSPSQNAASQIGDIDFLHLDGDYSEKGALRDVILYLPKVKRGGYILMSNLYMKVDDKYSKGKAFAMLFDACDVISRIENGNAVLLKKR